MNRLVETAAAATAAVLLASGCTPSPEQPKENTTSHSEAVEVAPSINITRPELPANIGNVAMNTVEIYSEVSQIHYYDTTGLDLGTATNSKGGSGEVVNYHGLKVIVTANHVESGMNDHCADQDIKYPATKNNGPFRGGVTKISPAPDKDGRHTFFHGQDSSVLIPSKKGRLAAYPGLTVQPAIDVQVGDNVFALGYGPRKNGDPDPFSNKRKEQPPAIIAGTVVEVTDDSASFITNIAGYPPLKDNEVQHGDSGGPVVTKEGKYLGAISTKTTEDLSVEDIELDYGVDLPENSDRAFNVATVQLVDTARLDDMLNATHGCDSQPATRKVMPVGTNILALPMPN
jgi:hypothetical protein